MIKFKDKIYIKYPAIKIVKERTLGKQEKNIPLLSISWIRRKEKEIKFRLKTKEKQYIYKAKNPTEAKEIEDRILEFMDMAEKIEKSYGTEKRSLINQLNFLESCYDSE